MNLYNCKSVSDGYRITKFTKDYVVEASYIVSAEGCDCPAGVKPICRHRTMMLEFERTNHIDDGWFFIWDTRQWLAPVGEAADAADSNERWANLRPQGAPSTSELDPVYDPDAPIDPPIAQPVDEPSLAAQPAPPTEPTPIAPQTEPASVEGAGFKLRRPKG